MSGSGRKVVVTGIGALTPLGLGASSLFDGLLEGRTGFRMIDRWDTTEWKTKFCAEVRGVVYVPEDHFTKLQLRRMDIFSQMGVVAAREAWADAGLSEGDFDPTRGAAIMGTGIGGLDTILEQNRVLLEKGPRRVTPYFIPNCMSNAVAAHVAINFGLQGACFVATSACASSGHAIGMAMREIREGRADVVVTGGAEAVTNGLCMAGFSSLKALSTRNDDPARSSRPFDRDRDGFVMGEGAGVLVLESEAHAKARGAKIYCEMAGFGQTDDAGHITAPDSTARRPAAAMVAAVEDAGVNLTDVDYINAHGTSTMLNDMVETAAIKLAFGDHAKSLAISSSKSMHGHLIGAAAGVEAVTCALTLQRGVAHQTLNLENPDLENGCDLDYIPEGPREQAFEVAVSNSLGFGGHNVSLAFRRYNA